MLEKELKDVPVDPSPTPVDETPDPEPKETPAEETPPETPAEQEKDRIYNLQREMDRKLEKQQREFLEHQERLMERVLEKVSTSSKAPNTLEEMSLVQLQNLKAEVSKMENVDAGTLAQIDDAIVDRRVQERVDTRLGAFTTEQRVASEREAAKAEALASYPDLRNPQSEFYQRVDRYLQLRGDAYVQSNPQAVLDAAARIAVETGVRPQPRTPVPTVARSHTNPGPKEKPAVDVEKTRELAKKLQKMGVLPSGKTFTDEQIKRIAERTEENRNKLTGGII